MSVDSFKQIYISEMKDSCKVLEQFPWEDKHCYANWLAQTYYFVKNSTRILSLAAGLAKPTEEILHKRMIEHLKEETGHEFLAIKDLEALGFQISDFPEMIETKNFYENQFYTIQGKGSSSLLGWIFFLEGIAEQFGKIAVLRTKVYGPKCTKFLRLHAEEDEDHIQSAFSLLESISDKEFIEIFYNFKNSKRLYNSILENIYSMKTIENKYNFDLALY